MKRRYKILLGVAGVLGVAYWVLLREASVPATCSFTLDLPKLRTLASSMPGDRPREIRIEHIASFQMPEAVMVTGGRMAMTEMADYAYQLVFPDRSIVVDTGMDEPTSRAAHSETYDRAAWTRIDKALHEAAAIYVTHEHGDHIGGAFAVASSLPRLDVLRLTREQLAHLDRAKPAVLPAAIQAQLAPLQYEDLLAIAPGVVLVKAAGHTPGSQLVFIQLADGREVLLTGDTAWHTDNIDERRGPPRFTSLILHNDRDANACQLAALSDLGKLAPAVHVVPGHDRRVIDRLIGSGVLQQGFR